MKEMFNYFLIGWPLLLGLRQNTNLTVKLPPPLGGKSKLLEREETAGLSTVLCHFFLSDLKIVILKNSNTL